MKVGVEFIVFIEMNVLLNVLIVVCVGLGVVLLELVMVYGVLIDGVIVC